jgi:hypothetical protein
MLDFWIPLLLLFIAATIGAITAQRRRDRCLRIFHQRKTIVLLNRGPKLWGKLNIYPKSIELEYTSPEECGEDTNKCSYILYDTEIATIDMLLQAAPAEGSEAYDRWQKEIYLVANPGVIRRLRRWCWNLFNMLRDAVVQALQMILGTLKTRTAMGKIAQADKRANEIGTTLLGSIPNAYEPILEKYLSQPVAVEMSDGADVREFVGLLQEYSEKYILLRNVAFKPAFISQSGPSSRFDIIFPRSKALVRHRMKRED